MLRTLEYRITVPTAHDFLVRYLKAGNADKTTVRLSSFVLDGTLASSELRRYLPSQLAAAAVMIARRTAGRRARTPSLLRYARYLEEEVRPVARAVLAAGSSVTTEWRAVEKKYSGRRYSGFSNTALYDNF